MIVGNRTGFIQASVVVFCVACGTNSDKGSSSATGVGADPIPTGFRSTGDESTLKSKAEVLANVTGEVNVGVEEAAVGGQLWLQDEADTAINKDEAIKPPSGNTVRKDLKCKQAVDKLNFSYHKALGDFRKIAQALASGKVPAGLNKATPTDPRANTAYVGEFKFGETTAKTTVNIGADNDHMMILFEHASDIKLGDQFLKTRATHKGFLTAATRTLDAASQSSVEWGGFSTQASHSIGGVQGSGLREQYLVTIVNDGQKATVQGQSTLAKAAEGTWNASGNFDYAHSNGDKLTKNFNVQLTRGTNGDCTVSQVSGL